MSCWYGYAPTPNGRSSYAITATGSACACTMGRRKNKLQEAVVDLAYNAGADNLWEDRDSRAVNAEIVQWAEEFETEHAGTDWDAEDYFLAIDRFYKEKTKQMNPVTIPAN